MEIQSQLRIGIIMGGHPLEYHLSIINGLAVIEHLSQKKIYEIKPVIIKDGKWQFLKDFKNLGRVTSPEEKIISLLELKTPWALAHMKKETDLVYLTPMCDWGENGVLQGWLEMAGISYTGSKVKASALINNRITYSQILKAYGIKVPEFLYFKYSDWQKNQKQIMMKFQNSLNFPVIIKPASEGMGSSRGVSLAKNNTELEKAIEYASMCSQQIMIQEFIKGAEVTCFTTDIFENNPRSFMPSKVIFEEEFLSEKIKNERRFEIEILDKYPELLLEKIKNIGIKIFRIFGCSGIIRTDMIVAGQDVFLLETNTTPTLVEHGFIKPTIDFEKIFFAEIIEGLVKQVLQKNRLTAISQEKLYDWF